MEHENTFGRKERRMNINVPDGVLKAMKGDYVLYKVDYLLDHLAREVHLLEEYRKTRERFGSEDTMSRVEEMLKMAERKEE